MEALLVCTVGGSPEPIAHSIGSADRPTRVVFIATKDTQSSILSALESTSRDGIVLASDQLRVIELSDPQNVQTCMDEMERELNSEIERFGPESGNSIIVDITGGTKPMSAALMLVTRRWPCHYRYVGGSERSKGGVGIVATGAEAIFECANPMDALGYAALEDALTLSARASYSAASLVLESARRKAENKDTRRTLQALESVTNLFAVRDRFQFARAIGHLHDLRQSELYLSRAVSQVTVQAIEKVREQWPGELDELAKPRVSRILIAELLANADRRSSEKRFDDCLARLYRATEAIAQFRLSSEYGVETGAFPFERLPHEMKARFQAIEKVKLGLQESYCVLRNWKDDVGHLFSELGLDARGKSPLETRNSSILAHGFQPVTEKALHLRQTVQQLAEVVGVKKEELPQFPKLIGREGSIPA